VFDLELDVDRFRVDANGETISNDPSEVILGADATDQERLDVVADRSNAVIHNREDYNTVARAHPAPDLKTPFISVKPGILIDIGTGSKFAGGIRWSAVTTGLQTYYANAAGYLELARMQLLELQAHKDEFLCAPFLDPDGILQGPTLSGADCALLQSNIEQIKDKTAVCHAALLKPQQGESRENCNALFTKIDNTITVLDTQITPPPLTNIGLIAPNYLGEWKVRLLDYRFTTEEWLLPVTPNGGIAAPLVTISQPADGSSFLATDAITFTATAVDEFPVLEDVTASIVWSSNRDGQIGSGGTATKTLSEGVHIITARATDSDGLPGVAGVVITVNAP
jgi:hypothetical protein